MARTIIDQGKEYEVYSEQRLEDAKEARKEGKLVYISRSCVICGQELFGSNLEIMQEGPSCEEHDLMAKYNQTFVSESGYYDVQSKGLYVPDVKAGSSSEAIEKIASENAVPVESLEVFEASNPGYREV